MIKIHCTQCGRENEVRWSVDWQGLCACTACGKELVDIMTLLHEVHRGIDEYRLCPRCNHTNRDDPFCYFCGHAYGRAEG